MFNNVNLGDFQNIVSSMQEQAKKLEEESINTFFTGESGGGDVKVVANGKFEIVDVFIDKSLTNDVESMQILLIGAINNALHLAREHQQKSALNMVNELSPVKM